mmetsp:Transcript_12637/g.38682  ORF Transcript_12637/g.38682 Transcript_12637/m.38682 type:complete len:208 (+) Transcript_12637:2582-3205(+)
MAHCSFFRPVSCPVAPSPQLQGYFATPGGPRSSYFASFCSRIRSSSSFRPPHRWHLPQQESDRSPWLEQGTVPPFVASVAPSWTAEAQLSSSPPSSASAFRAEFVSFPPFVFPPLQGVVSPPRQQQPSPQLHAQVSPVPAVASPRSPSSFSLQQTPSSVSFRPLPIYLPRRSRHLWPPARPVHRQPHLSLSHPPWYLPSWPWPSPSF